jgi:hypothetical protein
MNRSVVLVSFRADSPPEEIEAWLAAANQLAGSSVSPNLPGSVGGGDAVWDLRSDDGSAHHNALLDSPTLASSEVLTLDPIASGYRALEGARVKRTLALTVREGTPASERHRFERSLAAMPDHIAEIASWSLSRVGPGSSSERWTHVWEQEYAEVEGLRVAYIRSPYHWTGVDRWFDPEMPCSIVKPQLAHMFRWASGPILFEGPAITDRSRRR